MEKPRPGTVTYYEEAVPDDPRARKGAMFGHPCAFVAGNMFFGTFAQSVIIRVGEARARALARGPLRVFEPRPGRQWKEYLQVDADGLPPAKLASLAREALEWTATLPPKPGRAKAPAKARTRATAKPAARPGKKPLKKRT